MTGTKTTGAGLADELERILKNAISVALYADCNCDGYSIGHEPDCNRQITGHRVKLDPADVISLAQSLPQIIKALRNSPTQDQQDTAMAWTLAKIRQIIGVNEKPTLDQLPDLVRAAVDREWLTIEDAPRDGTITLLYAPHDMGGYIFTGALNIRGEWVDNVGGPLGYKPTHCMPLPAPPQTEGEGQ